MIKSDGEIKVECIEGELATFIEENITPEIWKWQEKNECVMASKSSNIFKKDDLKRFTDFLNLLPSNCFLEWTITKSDDLYFHKLLETADIK